uniref:Uncharacterized protein n=1 Tax=Otolemur garnettii TaxID=30611 RepID=H0XRG9_OTOGA
MIKIIASVSFKDVNVEFTQDEWWNLYRDVILENYNNLVSVGYCIFKPKVIFRLEHGEAPWSSEEEFSNQSHPKGHLWGEHLYVTRLWLVIPKTQKNTIQKKVINEFEFVKLKSFHGIHNEIESELHKILYSVRHDEVCEKCIQNVTHTRQTVKKYTKNKIKLYSSCHIEVWKLRMGWHIYSHTHTYELFNLEKSKIQVQHRLCYYVFSFSLVLEDYRDDDLIRGMRKSKTNTYSKNKILSRAEICNDTKATEDKSLEYHGKKFYQTSAHKVHQRNQSAIKADKCNEGEKSFCKKGALSQHQRTQTRDKVFECNECGKMFGQKSALSDHHKIHTGEKSFQCNECEKTFLQKSSLTLHQRIHSGEKPYQCNECEKSFSRSDHQRTHTGEKTCKCSECGKSSQKGYLVLHRRTHTGEKPFECNECGKAFSLKSYLNVHERIHRAEKPYKCNECGKTFVQGSALKIHQRIHTGEKPYECSERGKTFGQKSALRDHHKVHTGEKAFQCKECGKVSGHKSNLTLHQRIHSGEKSYQCNECEKSFSPKDQLIKHKRRHTQEKLFKCNECG